MGVYISARICGEDVQFYGAEGRGCGKGGEFLLVSDEVPTDGLQILNLMDLKQKQANLWEARSSREGAEQTAKQGKVGIRLTIEHRLRLIIPRQS